MTARLSFTLFHLKKMGRNALAGGLVGTGWVVGDELGEMGQEVWRAADAVLGAQAGVGEVADGSVEPGPGGVHDHGGGVVDQFGDGHAVAHRRAGGSGGAHGLLMGLWQRGW